MNAHSVSAPYSTFNNAGRDLIQHHYHPTISAMEAFSSIAPSPSPPPAFNDAPVDLLSIHFTGRKDELASMARAFNRKRCDIPLRCVLFGDPGVGKSQLTYIWTKTTFSRGQNSYIFWISANTIEKLHQGFSKLLHLVNHPDRSQSDQSVKLISARRWLEEVDSANWLLVLDNVSSHSLHFLREHLPRKNGRGSILFTTRTKSDALALASVAGEKHDIIEVPMLRVPEGVELFLGYFEDGEMDAPLAKIEEIVKSVGCLPLAISHATAFMTQSGSTVDDMLTMYRSGNKISLISWVNNQSDYEHQSVAATFICQLQDLERQVPDANNLLRVLAFFDPESIPLDMVTSGAQDISDLQWNGSHECLSQHDEAGGGPSESNGNFVTSLLQLIQSPFRLKTAVAQLQDRSLIAFQHKHSTLRMHDLIQLVVLENTKQSGANQPCYEFAVELACSAFRQIKDHASPRWWPQCDILIPHIQALIARQEISNNAKISLLLASYDIARNLRSRARYGEAETLYARVLADQKLLLGPEDIRTFATMNDLALVYTSQGRHREAEDLFKHVLSKIENHSASHRSVAHTAMDNLAQVYISRGCYKDAEALLEEVLRNRETDLGPEHLKTLATMHNLATVYQGQGRYHDAETLYKRVLSSKQKHLGPDHVDTLATMNMLALLYAYQRRNEDAEVLFTKVLSAREKQLGPKHIHTLTTMNDLGLVYKFQGRYDDAVTLLHRVQEHFTEQLGCNHVITLTSMDNVAQVYMLQGHFNDAEVIFKEVLLNREKQLGSDHIDTVMTMHNLASAYGLQGRYREAELLFKQVLASKERHFGLDHIRTAVTKHNLAMLVYGPQGRYEEAEELLVHVLVQRERLLGLSHPSTRSTVNALSSVYERLGRLDDVETLRQRAVHPPCG